MKRLLKSTVAVVEAVLILNTALLAQERPPTAGNPTQGNNGSDFPTILYPAIGAVVAGATYLLTKKRPSSLLAAQPLETYLLNNGILPTEDAYNLIYVLNPTLQRGGQIPARYKLTKPDFPDLPKRGGEVKGAKLGVDGGLLESQLIKMRTSLAEFTEAKVSFRNTSLNQNTIGTYLTNTYQQLNEYLQEGHERNFVKDKLLISLLGVLNRTVDMTVASGSATAKESLLMKDIADNIHELISPLDNFDIDAEKQGLLNLKHLREYLGGLPTHFKTTRLLHQSTGYLFLPRPDASSSKRSQPDRIYELQPFAFAVYKIDSNGIAITKGPEVEKKYQILYVCPALKDYPEAYVTIETSATYAFEHLPAARFHLIVKDPQNRTIELKNAIIDTRKAFGNQQKKYIDKHIIIPILFRK